MKTPKQRLKKLNIPTWMKYVATVAIVILIAFYSYSYLYPSDNHANNDNSPANQTDTTPNNTKPTTPGGTVNDTNIKNDQSNNSSAPSNSSTSNISIAYSFAGQDAPRGAVSIRTILDNTSGGECTYKLTKNSIEKSYSNQAVFAGTYYSCNYNVPYTDLSNGTWHLTVSVKQGNDTGAASTDVDIK